jgi:hypothetical protein
VYVTIRELKKRGYKNSCKSLLYLYNKSIFQGFHIYICKIKLLRIFTYEIIDIYKKCFNSFLCASKMLIFCPTCANILDVEESISCLRFACNTWPLCVQHLLPFGHSDIPEAEKS